MKILIVGEGVARLTLAALLYQRGEEPMIVEAESRRLAKLMLLKSNLLASGRNFIMRFMSENVLFLSISRSMSQPI